MVRPVVTERPRDGTTVTRLARLRIAMPDAPSSPAHPLLIYPGAVGDLILLTAVARGLARRWGAPCDLVARHAAAPEILAGLDSIADVAHLPSRSRPFHLDPVQWGLVRWLRERGPTPVYLIEERVHRVAPWRRETRMEWLLGRAGVGEEHLVVARRHRRDPLEHFVDYGLRLAALDPPAWRGAAPGGAAADGPRPVPELAVTDAELEEARGWLVRRDLAGPPLVLVQSGSRKRHRGRWPVERWPASPHEWGARHQMAEVGVDDVLAAWGRLEHRPTGW